MTRFNGLIQINDEYLIVLAGNEELLIDLDQSPDFVPREYPDGQVIDEFGYLWIAMNGGGRLVKVDPDTGVLISHKN